MLRKKKKNEVPESYEEIPQTEVNPNASPETPDIDSVDEIAKNTPSPDDLSPGCEEPDENSEIFDGAAENSDETAEKIDETDVSTDSDEMMEAFEAWLEDSVDNDETRENARCAMSLVGDAIKEGCFDDALFDIIAKGADYDRAVCRAEESGEIKGRNARIDELISRESTDDGVPHPRSSGGALSDRSASIFDIAREAY